MYLHYLDFLYTINNFVILRVLSPTSMSIRHNWGTFLILFKMKKVTKISFFSFFPCIIGMCFSGF